jgi:uncharacterized protein YdgA (DUF945 family)
MKIMKKIMNTSVSVIKNKKTISIVALVLMVFLVVFVVSRYLAGRSTEETFRDNMKEMAEYGAKVTVLDYKRGIFSGKASTRWVLARSGKEPVTLFFNHSIKHGPLLPLTSIARIRSELAPSKELTALLIDTFGKDPFGGKTPLTVESTHSLDGETYTRIVSPKFEIPAGEGQVPLSWGGLNGRITANSNFSKMKMRVVMDGLSMSGNDKDQFQMGRATLQADIKRARDHEHLFDGTSSLVLDKLLLMSADEDTGEIHGFALENARGETGTAIRNGALELKIRFNAGVLSMGDKSEIIIAKPGVTLLFENIDAQALETVLRATREEGRPISAFLEQTETLLKRKPVISIKDVSAGWPEGATKGNFRLAYTGDGNLDQFSLGDLAIDLQFNQPLEPINRLLAEQASQGYAEETKERVAMINAMISKGVMTEKDGVLNVDASLRDGALRLSGKPESLEVLQELLELF